MKRETIFLRFAVVLLGLPVIALCIFIMPDVAEFFAELNPKLAFLQYPFLLGLYAAALVFFISLYQAIKLLTYIDNNQGFSDSSIKTLKNIYYCAITIGGLYVVFLPLIYLMAEVDDAPGMILIGMAIIFVCMVVAAFASLLQKLFKNAMGIK